MLARIRQYPSSYSMDAVETEWFGEDPLPAFCMVQHECDEPGTEPASIYWCELNVFSNLNVRVHTRQKL